MNHDDDRAGLFSRWRARAAHMLLREPAIVLIDRESDPGRIGHRDDMRLTGVPAKS